MATQRWARAIRHTIDPANLASGHARLHGKRMKYDEDKVDEMVLALLFLTLQDGYRAWKGHDWGAMDRLHKKGMIGDPVRKAKSVALTEHGLQRSRELFIKHFAKSA